MKFSRLKSISLALAATSLAAGVALPAYANHHMEKKTNIVEAAASLDQFSTLVAAVKAADLAGTLSGDGPFTVFAPTNAAFEKLPAGTVETVLKPENKGLLTSILTYHVVAGKVKAADLVKMIKDNGGKATITTVQGGTLTASIDSHGTPILTDAKGNVAKITNTDLTQSNGVIHVIDTVVMP